MHIACYVMCYVAGYVACYMKYMTRICARGKAL
jgi:hypothetical protein